MGAITALHSRFVDALPIGPRKDIAIAAALQGLGLLVSWLEHNSATIFELREKQPDLFLEYGKKDFSFRTSAGFILLQEAFPDFLSQTTFRHLVQSTCAVAAYFFTKDLSLHTALATLLSSSEKVAAIALPLLGKIATLPIPSFLLDARLILLSYAALKLYDVWAAHPGRFSSHPSEIATALLNVRTALICLSLSQTLGFSVALMLCKVVVSTVFSQYPSIQSPERFLFTATRIWPSLAPDRLVTLCLQPFSTLHSGFSGDNTPCFMNLCTKMEEFPTLDLEELKQCIVQMQKDIAEGNFTSLQKDLLLKTLFFWQQEYLSTLLIDKSTPVAEDLLRDICPELQNFWLLRQLSRPSPFQETLLPAIQASFALEDPEDNVTAVFADDFNPVPPHLLEVGAKEYRRLHSLIEQTDGVLPLQAPFLEHCLAKKLHLFVTDYIDTSLATDPLTEITESGLRSVCKAITAGSLPTSQKSARVLSNCIFTIIFLRNLELYKGLFADIDSDKLEEIPLEGSNKPLHPKLREAIKYELLICQQATRDKVDLSILSEEKQNEIKSFEFAAPQLRRFLKLPTEIKQTAISKFIDAEFLKEETGLRLPPEKTFYHRTLASSTN